MRRVLISFLAILMVLSMAACTQTSAPQATATSQPSASPEQSASAQPSEPQGDSYIKIFDPPVTYTTVISTPAGDVLPDGQTVEDNLRSRLFTKQTGLVPKVLWSASGEAFTQKLNMMIASGDIPDYFEVNYAQYDALVKADLLADLTDLYNNLVDPSIKKIFESADNADIKAVTVKGKIYGIPKASGLGDSNPVMWVRKDWMEKLKMPTPTSIADIETMAQAFINNDPDGNSKNDTLGVVILPYYNSKFGGTGSVSDIFTNYGATPGQWRVKADGSVIYGSLMPEAVGALELLNGWYKKGIIPKDFATWNGNTYKQKVTSGAAGILFGVWCLSWSFMTDTVTNNPNAKWTAFALPKDVGSDYIGGAPNPAGYQIGVISKKMKNPENMIYALNDIGAAMQEVSYPEDIKAVTTVSNSYTPMTIFPLSANSIIECSTLAYRYAAGEITRDDVKSLTASKADVDYNLMIADAAKVVADSKSPYDSMKDWSNSMGYTIGMMALANANVKFIRSDFSGITDTMDKKGTFLDKLESEAYTKMIMGDTDGKTIQEYFDSFVQQYLSQGGQQITDEVIQAIR